MIGQVMQKNRKTKSFFIFLIIVPLAASAAMLDFPDSCGKIVSRTPDQVIRLVETPGTDSKTAEALFFIKGSPKACLKVVSDFKQYPEFMPNITAAEFVETKDSCEVFRFCFKVALWNIRYTNIFKKSSSGDGTFSLKWDYVKGDLKKDSGSWNIGPSIDKEGYSLVHYRVLIDTGMLVPHWVSDLLMAKSIPKMIAAIAERVASESPQ
jgi:ribosome-associated toxin RatA of RatAB toxin-antitoxin module